MAKRRRGVWKKRIQNPHRKKKRRVISHVAKTLRTPQYRKRVERDKTSYQRTAKHKKQEE